MADRLGEEHLHHRLAFGVLGAIPPDAVLALGAGDALVLPVHGELRQIQRTRRTRLPTGINVHRPNEVNPMRLATVQDAFGADVASIDQLLSGEQIGLREMALDRDKGMVVLLNRWGSVDVGDEMRAVVVTAFGHMDFVADPLQAPLARCSARRGRRASATTRPLEAVPAA